MRRIVVALVLSMLFSQDSPGVPDSVEFDDFLGEALAASGP
jgi:hypothetical protein